MCLLQPANAMFAETTRIHELSFYLRVSLEVMLHLIKILSLYKRPILSNFLNWEELNELVWLLI